MAAGKTDVVLIGVPKKHIIDGLSGPFNLHVIPKDNAEAIIAKVAPNVRGAAVTQMGRFAPLFREHQAANIGSVWDIHTDDLIPSRAYRRVHYGEA